MQYYIQNHERGVVGNCLLWWRENDNGYTCDLDDARVFDDSEEDFKDIVKNTAKYTAWKKDYIDECARRHVDHQNIDSGVKGVHREK